MLLSMKTLLDTAQKEKFCVPAPTVWSLETVEAAYEVGRACKTPLILMVWDDNTTEWIEKIGFIVNKIDRRYPDVPCALLLDHGQSFTSAMAALKAGYTTVMADYSMLPFEENVAKVQRVVKAAHALGIAVEAELGHVGEGYEYESTRDAGLTKPSEAREFVQRTGCDMLAVAVGTSHGTYHGTPRIEFDLLDELNEQATVPLVLHGGSGTGDENLRKASKHGICKVNLCTDLFIGYENAVREEAGREGTDFLAMYFAGANGYKEVLRHYVGVLDSENKSNYFADYLAEAEPDCRRRENQEFELTL